MFFCWTMLPITCSTFSYSGKPWTSKSVVVYSPLDGRDLVEHSRESCFKLDLVPTIRFELITFCLQDSRSTIRAKSANGGCWWICTTVPFGLDLQSSAFDCSAKHPHWRESSDLNRELWFWRPVLYRLNYTPIGGHPWNRTKISGASNQRIDHLC